MEVLLLLIYMVWSTYAGWQVVSGRIEWLERDATVNKVVKAIVCFGIGQLIGAFYLIYFILKLLFRF